MDRTVVSVSIKLKRLNKSNDTYNKKHIDDKYEFNKLFVEKIAPSSILDLYCGEKSFYKKHFPMLSITTNDINSSIEADFHKDALKLLCELYAKNYKYDLIDLDPFGSSYECFDLAIKMAKKGLCITFGELGHKRYKRLDFVERFYDIHNIEELNIYTLISKVQKIGLQNKKELKVVYSKCWENIGRVWFEIAPAKIIKPQTKKDVQMSLFENIEN